MLVFLTAPNDGGAQWGPRYLLFAYVPLAILAADAADPLGPGRVEASAQKGRRPGSWRAVLATALMLVLLALGLWSGRSSYRTLRGTKAEYGRLVDALTVAIPPHGSLATDVWWLDQATAAADRPAVLYADNNEEATVLIRRLEAAGRAVTIVTSRIEPRVTVPWTAGTCFRTVDIDTAARARPGCDPRGLRALTPQSG